MSWTQTVTPRTGTRDWAGRCLPFAQSVFGAPVRHDYAFQAWQAAPGRHTDRNFPTNVAVLVWFSHWGTYYSYSKGIYEYVNAGHVAVWIPGRGYLSSPAFNRADGQPSQQWFSTIEAVERTFGAKYVGWSEGINGLTVIRKTSGGGGGNVTTQRTVGKNTVKRRKNATTKSAEIQPALKPGTVGNFTGWKHGEKVGNTDIWFRGISGHWFWAGGFTSQSTTGLTDLNPKPVEPKYVHPQITEDGDEEMSKNIGSYIGGSASTPARDRSCVIYNPISGFYTTWSGVDQAYINEMARVFNTGNFNHVTKKHWDQTIRPRLDEIRLRK